jgi:hypothetical protein
MHVTAATFLSVLLIWPTNLHPDTGGGHDHQMPVGLVPPFTDFIAGNVS